MSSPEQIEANQRNGRLSHGPETVEGKIVSSKNSLKHGLLSRAALLPNEDPEAFAEFAEGFKEKLAPVGEVEAFLVERVIGLAWRLRRAGKIEVETVVAKVAEADRHARIFPKAGQVFIPSYGEGFASNHALLKLARYETSLERSFYKALHELERMQAVRQGKEVALPVAVEVNVSGIEPPLG